MPCTLLLASPPSSSDGVKVVLHPREGDASAAVAADGGGARIDAGGVHGSGTLIGVSVRLDCRAACTVELLWDVDLGFLGREMGVHPKQ